MNEWVRMKIGHLLWIFFQYFSVICCAKIIYSAKLFKQSRNWLNYIVEETKVKSRIFFTLLKNMNSPIFITFHSNIDTLLYTSYIWAHTCSAVWSFYWIAWIAATKVIDLINYLSGAHTIQWNGLPVESV